MHVHHLGTWLLCALCLLVVLFPVFLLRRRLARTVSVQHLETLSLPDVVGLFSSDSRKSYLKAHPECQATVLREVTADGVVDVKVCIYHTRKRCVVELLAHYHVEALAEDLISVFGQKDMLVLR